MFLLVGIVLLLRQTYGQGYGPYYYPNGAATDPIFITFGEYNTTHFYINLFVTGDHWFGFAFAGGSGCTPQSATCTMHGSDAIIFGQYCSGCENPLTAREYTLGDHNVGGVQAHQDIETQVLTQYDSTLGEFLYTANIRRPYNPELYGDRASYKMTYPFAGDFCWLWAEGTGLAFSNVTASHEGIGGAKGHECISFGPTPSPSPSPSYGPTPGPTFDPTPKPSKSPTNQGDSSAPTTDPTKEPTISPTHITNAPSIDPTLSPTPGPTKTIGSPSQSPTKRPTKSPTNEPTSDPTMRPTPPGGQTRQPSPEPTSDPTTPTPTITPGISTGVPSSAPTRCIQDTTLTNTDCVDDSCAEKPYLDFKLSFSVCKKQSFVGNRYGLWDGVVNCLCDLAENGKYLDYNYSNDRRRLKRGNNECDLNVIKYGMDTLTEAVAVNTNCDTVGYRFYFGIEDCGECVTLTQTLKMLKDMTENEIHKAISQCSNWFAKRVDTVGFDGVYDVDLETNEEFGTKCDIQTGRVNSKFDNVFIVIIVAMLFSAVLV